MRILNSKIPVRPYLQNPNSIFKSFLYGPYFERYYQAYNDSHNVVLNNAAEFRQEVITEWSSHLNGADFRAANLREIRFDYAKLKAADFRGANFHKSSLEGAQLEKADFRQVNIQNSNLKQAKLMNADFSESKIKNSDFQLAELRGANFNVIKDRAILGLLSVTDVLIKLEELREVNISTIKDEAMLHELLLTEHLLKNKPRIYQQIISMILLSVDPKRTRLSGVDFKMAQIQDVDFGFVFFDGVNFRDTDLHGTSFNWAILKGASFAGANLVGVSFERANLDGASFADVKVQYTKDQYGNILSKRELERIDAKGLKAEQLIQARNIKGILNCPKSIVSEISALGCKEMLSKRPEEWSADFIKHRLALLLKWKQENPQ